MPSAITRPRLRPVTATALTALLSLGALAGCGGDDEGGIDRDAPAEVGSATSVTNTTATSAPATTAGPTTAPPPVGVADPEEAAATLYAAWKIGDRATAASVAEPAAVEGVWAAAPGDYRLYNKCNTGEFGQSSCLFRGDPGTIQFNMKQHETTWVVTGAIFSPA